MSRDIVLAHPVGLVVLLKALLMNLMIAAADPQIVLRDLPVLVWSGEKKKEKSWEGE